jgi:pyruvate,water dikinase
VAETHIVGQQDQIVLHSGGGLERRPVGAAETTSPSLTVNQLEALARWGVRIEDHFRAPQDIEWLVDEQGKIWILQARPLALVEAGKVRSKSRTREEPILTGGRTIFPGQVSGPAHLIEESQPLRGIPEGSILFLRRASPEIVETFPSISGIVAERGNLAGHAASLLREFKVPSVFLMKGAFERIQRGDAVSLDAAQAKVYPGTLWAARRTTAATPGWRGPKAADRISERLLTLNLIDPQAHDFRPAGCRSAHDVIRFCHEKALRRCSRCMTW